MIPILGCGGSLHSADEKFYLISTNIQLPYWKAASAGLAKGAIQMHVRTEFAGPDNFDPKAELEAFRKAVAAKPTGILISAADPDLLKADIDQAIGQGIPVITIDSDAPSSKRLLFIGTDNFKAGQMGGELLAKQLKGKGNVVVFSMPQQANLKERLRGYQDALANHPQIKITEVIDIKGDPRIAFDRTMEMLEKKAKVDAFVNLQSLSGPEVASVLERKNVTGKVVVAMDTDARTLEAVQKGTISATIGQKPFTMAFLAIKMLDDLHHHPLKSMTTNWSQDSFSPLPAFVDTGATLVDNSNVGGLIEARKAEAAAK